MRRKGTEHMDLDLRGVASNSTAVSDGIAIVRLPWLFWIKAGAGLAFGAALVWLVGMVIWALFWPYIVLNYLRVFYR